MFSKTTHRYYRYMNIVLWYYINTNVIERHAIGSCPYLRPYFLINYHQQCQQGCRAYYDI